MPRRRPDTATADEGAVFSRAGDFDSPAQRAYRKERFALRVLDASVDAQADLSGVQGRELVVGMGETCARLRAIVEEVERGELESLRADVTIRRKP